MKPINAELVAARKQELEERRGVQRQEALEDQERYQEERRQAARPKVIDLLVQDDLMSAMSLAFEVGIEDEVDDSYLRAYADKIIGQRVFSAATYEVAASIYTKLNLPKLAVEAKELYRMAKYYESTEGVFDAMTR